MVMEVGGVELVIKSPQLFTVLEARLSIRPVVVKLTQPGILRHHGVTHCKDC